jgi:hypothetical protein
MTGLMWVGLSLNPHPFKNKDCGTQLPVKGSHCADMGRSSPAALVHDCG